MRTYFAVAKSHFVLNALMYNKKSLFLVKVERIYQGLCLYNCNIFFYKWPVHSTFYICAVRIHFAVTTLAKVRNLELNYLRFCTRSKDGLFRFFWSKFHSCVGLEIVVSLFSFIGWFSPKSSTFAGAGVFEVSSRFDLRGHMIL